MTPSGGDARDRYGSEPFFPHHVIRQAIQLAVLSALLVLLSSLFPPPMPPEADPFNTPANIKPEWYFLAAHQFLKAAEALSFLGAWAPKVLGILAQGFLGMAVWFLPFWDTNPERHPARRPTAIRVGIGMVFFFLVMTVWGYFS
ncbi:MAG: hypothetical protein M1550_00340 [Deltaproteobacteria bacterium]|nr:hypothetical protein [Deltaproteobacteria bacterium]